MRELALARRVQDGHLDGPQRAHRVGRIANDPDRLLDGRIEQLHVPEHQPPPIVVGAFHGGQATGLGTGDGQGLLAEHGQAALEGRPTTAPCDPEVSAMRPSSCALSSIVATWGNARPRGRGAIADGRRERR